MFYTEKADRISKKLLIVCLSVTSFFVSFVFETESTFTTKFCLVDNSRSHVCTICVNIMQWFSTTPALGLSLSYEMREDFVKFCETSLKLFNLISFKSKEEVGHRINHQCLWWQLLFCAQRFV